MSNNTLILGDTGDAGILRILNNKKKCTLYINGESGFIDSEGIRSGDLIIGSKGSNKDTHIKGIRGKIFFDQKINLKSGLDISGDLNISGNIGIGTQSPGAALDVHGAIYAGNSDIYFTKTDHNYSKFGSPGCAAIENAADFGALMILGRSGTPKGRYVRLWDYLQIIGGMDITGSVGIGTATPDGRLTIKSDNQGQGTIRFFSKNADMEYDGGSDDAFLIKNTKENGKTIFMGGNIGIGTLTPSAKLEVNGDIKVTGDIFLTNADCAEEFDTAEAESVQPGTVMVIDKEGVLRPSEYAYDKRVAGVISGACDLRPGITLDKQSERTNRLPLALTGKVYCKVDAQYGPIEVGDLLTTSPTCGHAMKATDPGRSFGTVIGKALRELVGGKGMIPILVALQ